ncbi:DUF6361 family protein [Mesorhizobium sp. WSM1497]|uniref:DUF6361 family protein n=1 Tax=Mesorhizobium sp. WSM1497 TaxID=278153 RepID=UPI001FD9E344|nr:DUF6361 family protein [Mesorhizobium sp. WSM1497]
MCTAHVGILLSSIGWIDFDEKERERANALMQLFTEHEARDELGLGAIRDSIADHLFPGTSTVQTRLRYMLFVPWIFSRLPRHRSSIEVLDQMRSDQLKLRNALVTGMESNGVIGVNAGRELKRLPASVYWAGLENWGIRLFPGSIDSYAASLPSWPKESSRDHAEDDYDANRSRLALWHPQLPAAPKGLFENTSFALSDEEAEFIVDRLNASNPDSLLTFLARKGGNARAGYIWAHPHVSEFPARMRRLVEHASIFSEAMYGAALHYNLQLSQLRGKEDWVEDYKSGIAKWQQDLDLARLKHWSLEDFWDEIRHPAHRVLEPARRFVTDWTDLLKISGGLKRNKAKGLALVKERERRLKKGLSRFTNQAALSRWKGASGAYRLQFRWSQASRHLQDLARG